MLMLCPFASLLAQTTGVQKAEDLWGNSIDFNRIIHSPLTTVIQPFSSSNCGYCLIDGWFIEKNFLETNRKKGGINFTQSIFNPQLDNYAFTKHYRDTLTPVLTYPPELHQYHLDGFPAILAFRNGEQIVKIPEGSLFPYDSSFEKLKMTLWHDTSIHFQPSSELHFATRIIYENMNNAALCVVPDGNQTAFDKNLDFAKRTKCYQVKFMNQISHGDMVKNVMLEGRFPRGIYRYFTGENSPFKLESDSVMRFGPYRFGTDTIGICACIPNPLNPEKYLVIRIRGGKVTSGFYDNSVDYAIYSYDEKKQSTRVLLHGFFEKRPGNSWHFSDSLCISRLSPNEKCIGVCTIPAKKFLPEHPVSMAKPLWRPMDNAEEFTLGNSSCRFPSMVADDRGTVWVCREERGDILLSSVDRKNSVSLAIEQDKSDSYNPLITFSDGKIWIFYLNNRDGFYRLYGRSYDGSALTRPLLYSEIQPCDVVTPAVVPTKSGIVVAWTCWKANFRFPFYRLIRNGIPDSIHAVSIAKSPSMDDYINAWYFSLDADLNGKVWGAWNQHYPAALGVCGGDLDDKAISVTAITENPDDCENGGYPSAMHDQAGNRWVFWESFPWGVLDGEQQRINFSMFDAATRTWSSSATLPMDSSAYLNQTPQAVSLDDGRIVVVWSGRSKEGNWALYLTCKDNFGWSRPIRLTSGREPARAPKIIAGKNNELWIAFHDGAGEKMKVRVIKMNPPEKRTP